jgi:hypothetical protein
MFDHQADPMARHGTESTCTKCYKRVHVVFHVHPDRTTTTTWAHNPVRKS